MKKTTMAMMMLAILAVTVEVQAFMPPSTNTVSTPVVADHPVLVPVVDPVVVPVAKPVPVREPRLIKAPVKDPNFWVRVYGGCTFEADIETPSPEVGVEVGLNFSETISIGLGVTSWSDEDELKIIQMDVLSFGATLYWTPKVLRGVYVGAGASLSKVDMKASLPGINIDVEDSTGIHGVIGYEKKISRRLGLFGEVQYHDANTTATIWSDCGDSEVAGGSINRGVFIAGVKVNI